MLQRVCIVFVLLAGSVAAQISSVPLVRRVRVHVVFADGACDISTHVKLLGATGSLAEAAPDSECEVDFSNVPEGNYDLKVSGQTFAATSSVVMTSGASNDFDIRVTRAGEAGHDTAGLAPVSIADLSIPVKARKEFEKANQLISRDEFPKAIRTLNDAIAIYPDYAAAYNNLGVIYARLGDRAHEREALEKAININDHFAAAYVNVGRMNIAANDFAGGESALTKATSLDPSDAMTQVLLAYCQFMNHHLDEAIASSRKAHALQGPHASAHFIAARAYEQKRDKANAVAEMELFLKEEPSGNRADVARKELAALRAIHQ